MKATGLGGGRIATRKITIIGLLGAITIIMGLTGIGFIPLPTVRATIMHLPVIIGAIIEGPMVGAAIGLIFGFFSMYQAITAPVPTSFVFLDPLVAILPRILIGIVSYYVFKGGTFLVGKVRFGNLISIITAAALGTMTNTVGVLGMIYLRHGAEFVRTIGGDVSTVGKILMTIGITSGIPEAVVACIITTLVVKSMRAVRL